MTDWIITAKAESKMELPLSSAARKFARYVLPILCLMYFVSWLDRQNVSFAKLQMLGDLGMTENSYGFGASLFFIGFALFALPSGLMLTRFGAKRWFAIIMTGWGVATMLLALNPSEPAFYALRFIIGALEAGFSPGVYFFLSLWASYDHRTRFTGIFIAAGMLSNALGAPVCGFLLDLGGTAGLHGWQWLFLLTGVPAVLLGLAIPWLLTETPEEAKFYTPAEKRAVAESLSQERKTANIPSDDAGIWRALLDARLFALAGTLFGSAFASFGLSYWMPTIVHEFGVSNTVNGLLNSLPWLSAMLALWFTPLLCQQNGRWQLGVLIPYLIAAVALFAVVLVESNVLRMLLICVSAAGIFAPTSILVGLPTVFLNGKSAAPAIGAANAVAVIGAFASQNAIPILSTATASVMLPMFLISAVLILTAISGYFITCNVLSDLTNLDRA